MENFTNFIIFMYYLIFKQPLYVVLINTTDRLNKNISGSSQKKKS